MAGRALWQARCRRCGTVGGPQHPPGAPGPPGRGGEDRAIGRRRELREMAGQGLGGHGGQRHGPGRVRRLEWHPVPAGQVQLRFHPDSRRLFVTNGKGTTPRDLESQVRSLKKTAEKEAILEALRATGGNRKEAAQRLNISVRALQYKIRDLESAEVDEMIPSGRNGRAFGAS